VTALYLAHALGLIRFAYLMLGGRQAAVLAATLTLTSGPGRSGQHRTGPDALLARVPRYYIVLPDTSRTEPLDRIKQAGRPQAEIRATATQTMRPLPRNSPSPNSPRGLGRWSRCSAAGGSPGGGQSRSRPCCGRTLTAARCSCWPTGQA
jgi:hypothetical protein